MMKTRSIKMIMFVICAVFVSACSNVNTRRQVQDNTVAKVIEEQILKEDNESTDANPPEIDTVDEEEVVYIDNPDLEETSGNGDVTHTFSTTVDYDLTEMNGDMVFAMVLQLMIDPDTYVGKTFRMDGMYYSMVEERDGKRHFYCLIIDATACCAQGIEFVWDDGSHVYPDEYPAEDSNIVVEGTFETYPDETNSNVVLVRLKDTTLMVQ